MKIPASSEAVIFLHMRAKLKIRIVLLYVLKHL